MIIIMMVSRGRALEGRLSSGNFGLQRLSLSDREEGNGSFCFEFYEAYKAHPSKASILLFAYCGAAMALTGVKHV